MPRWWLSPLSPTSSQCVTLSEAGLVFNILLSLPSLLPSSYKYKMHGTTPRSTRVIHHGCPLHCCCRRLVVVVAGIFIFVPVAVFVPVFVFVVVVVNVADILACHPPRGNGKAGRAGLAAVCNAVGLLLSLVIVVAATAFTLALWMPSLFCLKTVLLTGADVFNDVGAGTGTIVGMFVDDIVRGANQAANAARAVTKATTACAEISSSPPRPPTLYFISSSAPSLA